MMALDRSPESFSHKMNSTFLVPIVPTCDPWGGPVLNPEPSYEKRDKGPLLDATYQISKL